MTYHYKRKTPEEKQKELEELTKQLEKGVNDFLESDKYKEILNNFSKFYDYSYKNSMLIMLQKPDAEAVASYTSWKNNFNRQVNAGEHGIKIIQPVTKKVEDEQKNDEKNNVKQDVSVEKKDLENEVTNEKQTKKKIVGYKVAYTFDISQTSQIEGKPVIDLEMTHELQGNVHDYEDLKEAIKAAAPVPIAFEEVTGGAKGYYDTLHNQIVINDGMSESQTLKTMIHETAHSLLHSKEAQEERKENGLQPVGRDSMEVQAESISYVVSEHYGLDTSDYSFPYVASWAGDTEKVTKNLTEIKNGSATIIEKMDQKLEEIEKEKMEAVQHVQEVNQLAEETTELAKKIDDFAHNFDSYDYADQEIYPGSNYDQDYVDVLNLNMSDVKQSLQNIIEDDWDHDMSIQAKSLINDIERYENYAFNAEAKELAKEMDGFFKEFSPTEYYFSENYPGCHIDQYFSELRNGKTETSEFLGIIKEGFDGKEAQEAAKLQAKIRDFSEKYADRIEGNLSLKETPYMKR